MGFYLCKTQFPDNNSHVAKFENRYQQTEYFKSIGEYVEAWGLQVQPSAFLSEITVPFYTDYSRNYDYVFYENQYINFCFFVTGYEYVSEGYTKLFLECDVMQTYQFHMDLNTSFVKRCHVQRWTSDGYPMINYQDEGLEYGDIIQETKEQVKALKEQYILCTNVPIGTLKSYQGGGGEGGDTSIGGGGNVQNAEVSDNFICWLKRQEGFGEYWYELGDGTRTVGYGVTQVNEPNMYNELLANGEPIDEKHATECLYRLIKSNYATPLLNDLKNKGVDISSVKQNEFDGLVDMVYNCGLSGSQNIIKAWIRQDSDLQTQWENYRVSGWEGLPKRRKSSWKIFANGEYEKTKAIDKIKRGTNNKPVYYSTVEGCGYMPDRTSSVGQSIVESARKLIGLPYVWGGNYPPLGSNKGTDCSGLCQWAFNDNGIKITRTTYTQINEGKEVQANNLQLGDLVFSRFSSPNVPEHVCLYSGYRDGEHYWVEAPRTGLNIREITFNPNDTSKGYRYRRLI